MRVLHINGDLAAKGGVETYLFAVIPLLRERGIESLIAFDEGDAALYDGAYPVGGMKSSSFANDRGVEESLMSLLRREKPEVVHVHNVQNVGVVRACSAYGRTVMTAHDYRSVCPANMFYWRNGSKVCTRAGAGPGCFAVTLRRDCLSRRPKYAAYHYRRAKQFSQAAQTFSNVIAPSGRARDRLIRGGMEKDRVVVLPYFCPVVPRENPRPVPERPTITFIGRIAANKGQEYFIEALGQLPQTVRGVMVGNMSDQTESGLHAMAERFGCRDRLELRRWATREEIVQIMDETSVFIFPSLWEETLGIVGLEAMARGVPVVASDIGGVNEWLIDGVNGFSVPRKSASAIAEGVKRILDSHSLMESFGLEGIRLINSKFSPAKHVKELSEVYERASSRN